MSIAVIPPPEYAFVGNPVFVSVSSDNSVNTVMVDIYYEGAIVYTAAVPAIVGTQRINIAEVLQSFVSNPLPWPLPSALLSPIINWMISYRIVVREMVGSTVMSSWSSTNRYAVPGAVPPAEYKSLLAAGTDIFKTRFLNPSANRFLTEYADASDQVVTLPAYHPAFLFFAAKTGETLYFKIQGGDTYTFEFAYSALYLINLATVLNNNTTATAQFSNGLTITIRFQSFIANWPVRAWLFLNQFGVFEPFFTTGRAETSVTRPENSSNRYVPDLDAFYPIDLPSKPVEKIKLQSGYNVPNTMKILSQFTLSEWVYLIVGGAIVYYVIKQAVDRLLSDDNPEPHNEELDCTCSVRDHHTPTYGERSTVFYVDPSSVTLPWREGSITLQITSLIDGQSAAWSFTYVPATPATSALNASIDKIDSRTLKVSYPANGSQVWHSGVIEITQTDTGKKITCTLSQQVSQRVFKISPDFATAGAAAGSMTATVTNTVDGGAQLDWRIYLQDTGATWCRAEKISGTQARISWDANVANAKRGPVIFMCKSTEFDAAADTFELTQEAAPVPVDNYEFALDTSGIVDPDVGAGKYACNIPASGNGTITVLVTSTKNGSAATWSIQTQTAFLHAVNDGGNLKLTPDDNASESIVGGTVVMQQQGSLSQIVLTVRQDGKVVPSYTFRIEGDNFTFNDPAVTQMIRHVISSSSNQYVNWTVDSIEYIDGGNNWFTVVRDGENLKANILSPNYSSVRRFAIIHIKQADTGLIETRNITQAVQVAPVFTCNPSEVNEPNRRRHTSTRVTSKLGETVLAFTAAVITGEEYIKSINIYADGYVEVYYDYNETPEVRHMLIQFTQSQTGLKAYFHIWHEAN